MIEDSGPSTSKPRNWTRLAALLAVFALSFVTIRLVAGRSAGGYSTPPFFHLFFSDTIHMKAWLATGAITLARPLSGPERGTPVRAVPLRAIRAFLGQDASHVRISGHPPDAASCLPLHLPTGV